MIQLNNSLQVWGTPDFNAVLKREIAQYADALPLHQALSSGTAVADEPITLLIHSVAEMDAVIRVKAGICYKGLLLGCSCADDPTPPGESNEYCDVQLDIDKASGATVVTLVLE